MKTYTSKWLQYFCRARFGLAVAVGLGVGWAMSKSLGAAVAFAVGGSITVALLARSNDT
ncbi:MAG: hypothetical protein PSW75_10155 [bacterium]|nr:hypothetical protein [bacterium]MDI1337310.1 hypothetical protein [Lacunisphaera sp.]